MRDEGFDTAAITSQLVENEGFDSTGALVQLAASHVPSTRRCDIRSLFSGWGEPFVGVDDFPQMEYSTSVNKVDRKIDKQIYDNLTTQGMARMSPDDSKYKPYHCPKGLME